MTERAQQTLLVVNASARTTGSQSRILIDRLVDRLAGPDDRVVQRDLGSTPPPTVDEVWIGANFTAPGQRTAEQDAALTLSDTLVRELQDADTILIGAPIYNFGTPAALKAWIDLIARARVTFRYTPDGPEGLLKGKRAIVVVTSGGTPVGSDGDFATDYLKHVLGFLGITDVEIIAADGLAAKGADGLAAAEAHIDALADAAAHDERLASRA